MSDKDEGEMWIAHAMKHGSPDKTFAEGWFDATRKERLYESGMIELLWSMLGTDSWSELTSDYYDASFEIHGCDDSLAFTPEQLARFWALGFQKCWINHKDGTETHYWKSGDQAGYRKRKVC